jgi:hypothetical protein
MRIVVKGMVQLESVTYRIVRVRAGQYEVVRLLDDAHIGLFSIGVPNPTAGDAATVDLIREIARLALHSGRTSWVGHQRSY